jgi:hypothetical protein
VEETAAASIAAGGVSGDVRGRARWGEVGRQGERVGPTDRGWRRGSLYRGDGEEVLVYGEKKGGDRGTAG